VKVPTWKELEDALRLPEVIQKYDRLGRVIRKKNPQKIASRAKTGRKRATGE
jgi:hypothetical protein